MHADDGHRSAFVLDFSIGVSASSGYDRQEADACITISQRVSVKGGSGTNSNTLKYNGDGTWTSNEGLIYGQSQDGNRVIHVLKHTISDQSKPLHTVYNVDKSNVIGLVDEAWQNVELEFCKAMEMFFMILIWEEQ